MKGKFVKEMAPGDAVDTYFLVSFKESPRPYNNKPGYWFKIKVSDKTGTVPVMFWGKDEESVRELFGSFDIRDVVSVRGTASMYREQLQVSVNQGEGRIQKIAEFDPADLLPVTDKDRDEMKSRLMQEVAGIQNQPTRRLLESLFGDAQFLDKFATWPAAKNYHHGYVGGLIEHSLNMISLARAVAQNYDSTLDTDLLTAGCILHDIGKLSEYDVQAGITFSEMGDYLGHVSIGAMMIQAKISSMRQSGEDFPEKLEREIIHIILSHHGTKEHGSPVEPITAEAMVVHKVDACDAQVKHMIEERERNNPN